MVPVQKNSITGVGIKPPAPSPHWLILSYKFISLGVLFFSWYVAYVSLKIFYSDVWTYEAQQLINTRRAPEAEAAGIRSVLFNSDNGYAHYYLGAFYKNQGRLVEAESALKKAIRTMAHPATPLLLLAEINFMRQHYAEALRYYTETFKMNPNPRYESGKRWFAYGKAAVNAGHLAMGIYAFQQAINLKHKAEDLFQSLGAQFYRLGLHQMAILEFEQQILYSPREKRFYTDLAGALQAVGEADEGVRFFSRLRKIENNPQVTTFLANFHLQKKDYAVVQQLLDEVLQADEREPLALFLMGQCYYCL
ncbi:MAG: hypothetical protein N2246_09875, partial [Candidatus Sumerlaeia bacterium]|nr:hypothetical protein [Candidatus Sumerlaeia bacterium]